MSELTVTQRNDRMLLDRAAEAMQAADASAITAARVVLILLRSEPLSQVIVTSWLLASPGFKGEIVSRLAGHCPDDKL